MRVIGREVKHIYRLFCRYLPTRLYCVLCGLHYVEGMHIVGKISIARSTVLQNLLLDYKSGIIKIGVNFSCNNKYESNSIGFSLVISIYPITLA